MDESEKKQPQPEKTERVKERLDNVAYSLGYFLGNTRLRAQRIVEAFPKGNIQSTTIHQEPVEEQNVPSGQHMETNSLAIEYAATPSQPEPGVVHKVKDVIEMAGIQLDILFTASRILARRTTVRIRENAENIWVESQMLRKRQRRRQEQS